MENRFLILTWLVTNMILHYLKMQDPFLLEFSPRVFIFSLNLKKHLLTFIFIFFFIVQSFANDIGVEDTLLIHPISFSTPSPEGWVAQYKVTIDFPDENWSWRKILMVQTNHVQLFDHLLLPLILPLCLPLRKFWNFS